MNGRYLNYFITPAKWTPIIKKAKLFIASLATNQSNFYFRICIFTYLWFKFDLMKNIFPLIDNKRIFLLFVYLYFFSWEFAPFYFLYFFLRAFISHIILHSFFKHLKNTCFHVNNKFLCIFTTLGHLSSPFVNIYGLEW